MSLVSTLNFIVNHPLNKNQKFNALLRYFKWQIGSRLVPGPVVVNFVNNAKLLVAPGMTGATGNIYTGLHDFEDMSFILHVLRPNDLFLDIGANIGTYTVLASVVAGARSIAFEPVPATFKSLQQQININEITELVTTMNMALGREEGNVKFTSGLDTMNHVVAANEENDGKMIDVPVKLLDSIAACTDPFAMKIDVEGFETDVIAGADQILKKVSLHAVIMELNGSGNRYGFDENILHEKMRTYGFNSYSYSPLDRTLHSLDGKNSQSGNTLYLRNVECIKERIRTAAIVHVNSHDI